LEPQGLLIRKAAYVPKNTTKVPLANNTVAQADIYIVLDMLNPGDFVEPNSTGQSKKPWNSIATGPIEAVAHSF